MNSVLGIAFAIGLGVVTLNWLTTIIAFAESRATKKNFSPIWIPYLGPIGLTIAFVGRGLPVWTLVFPWVLDIGTLAFLRVTPWLIGETWRFSRFTRLMVLEGRRENQSVRLSLHRRGHYQLIKTWQRAKGELGIIGLSEPGSYEHDGPDMVFTSHYGSQRRLSSEGDGSYAVAEIGDVPENYSIQNWVLRIVDGDISQCS